MRRASFAISELQPSHTIEAELVLGFSVLVSKPADGFSYLAPVHPKRAGVYSYYWLTPPSRAIFFVSVLLAVLALLVRYAHVAIPVVSHYTFETLLLAFVLLLAGNMFRGL